MDINIKINKVKEILKNKKIALAFSAGADSTLLAYLAKEAGADVLAITYNNQIFPSGFLEFAKRRASEIGIRHEIIEESLEKHGHIILCENMEDAIDFTNTYAPEHLIISTADDKAVLDKIKNAGSIFLGKYSPVAAGDYGSGTNHVLPTGGGAKMYSGLSTEAFLKKPTVQTLTREGIEELSKTVIPIAEYEGFYAHANSVKVRLDKK